MALLTAGETQCFVRLLLVFLSTTAQLQPILPPLQPLSQTLKRQPPPSQPQAQVKPPQDVQEPQSPRLQPPMPPQLPQRWPLLPLLTLVPLQMCWHLLRPLPQVLVVLLRWQGPPPRPLLLHHQGLARQLWPQHGLR
jgi:hypothetical protein